MADQCVAGQGMGILADEPARLGRSGHGSWQESRPDFC